MSSGQGLMAVALVVFARWNPLALHRRGAAVRRRRRARPVAATVGVTQGYYLFYAAPYVLTLAILIATVRARPLAAGHAGRTVDRSK